MSSTVQYVEHDGLVILVIHNKMNVRTYDLGSLTTSSCKRLRNWVMFDEEMNVSWRSLDQNGDVYRG